MNIIRLLAEPAKLVITVFARHVEAAAVFVDRDVAIRALFRKNPFINLAFELIPRFVKVPQPFLDFFEETEIEGLPPFVKTHRTLVLLPAHLLPDNPKI
jgi:hypothetical protein